MRRVQAVRELLGHIDRMVIIGGLRWSLDEPNYLALAINSTFRRQRQALGASVTLAETGQGDLAVGFVRPALDERLWLAYLCSLDRELANKILLAMGRYDAIRSLQCQRDYIGDEAMLGLWYPSGFVDANASQLDGVKAELKNVGNDLGWGNRPLPGADWLAKQVGATAEYDYLHSATSRVLHFSAGEIMRRGWGTPGEVLITDKPEFREHLTEFALDQLWRLWLATLRVTLDHLEDAGLTSDPTFDLEPEEVVGDLSGMGRVPLVHAHEWNLTPEGQLPLPRPPLGDES